MQITSWANSRIVITGSSGFVGNNLVAYFQEKKARVVGLSRHPRQREIEKRVDVLDKEAVISAMREIAPHACFHLASEALVEIGQSMPYTSFHNNIVSTLNVLEACRILRVPRIIIASTVHVYGDSPLPYREDEPARPSRPYETSKTCADLIAQSYADSFNLPVLIPRFVNIYGPGDTNTTRIVPKTIMSLLQDKQPTLWGGNAKRDYLYIDDAVSAYDLLGKMSDAQIERNRIYNFAAGHPVTAKKLIETIIALMGKEVKIKRIPTVRENELTRQDVNWEKARRILHWAPATDLTAGLLKTIEWFRTGSRAQ